MSQLARIVLFPMFLVVITATAYGWYSVAPNTWNPWGMIALTTISVGLGAKLNPFGPRRA
jgi:hypothetical protein